MAETRELHAGWYLVGMVAEIVADLTPVEVAHRRLMLVRSDDGRIELAEATCPHRGAHLAYGGKLSRDRVVCPFHGRLVALGCSERRAMSVPTYPTMVVGGMVLARLGQAPELDRGLAQHLPGLLDHVEPVVAVDRVIRTTPQIIIENAFDPEHFATVHQVPGIDAMHAEIDDDGALTVGGGFRTVVDPWGDPQIRQRLQSVMGRPSPRAADLRSGFRATAYSPTFVVTRFGEGPNAPLIVTGAVPVRSQDHRPAARIRVVLYADTTEPAVERMARGSRAAISEDTAVWENLDPDHVDRLTENDSTVLAFQHFCAQFPGLT